MKKGLRIGCIALAAVWSAASLYAPAAADTEAAGTAAETQLTTVASAEGEYVPVCSSGGRSLYFNEETGAFYIEDTASGNRWKSTPPYDDTDESLKSAIKAAYDSPLFIKYADNSGNIYELPSKTASVNLSGMSWEKTADGVRVTYTFPKQGITVPVEYVLENGNLTVGVVLADIREENAKCRLTGFSLLPYFNAGVAGEEGFLLVPDGSGAIIRFNNGKSANGSYQQYVYGRDSAIGMTAASGYYENALLPVFGSSAPGGSCLAVITQGEARAVLNASVSGANTICNTVYSECIYRENTMASFNDKSWNKKEVRVIEENPPAMERYEVTYLLMDGGASYTDMAGVCREYLLAAGTLDSETPSESYPLYLNLYGSVNNIRHILGFPIESEIALTTYQDAIDILGQLEEKGAGDLVVKYNNWIRGGPESSIPVKAAASGTLGGKSSLKKLTAYMEQNDIAGFFDVNLTDMYKSRWGYIRTLHSARMLNQSPAIEYSYSLSTLQREENMPNWYLLRPDKVETAAQSMAKTLASAGISGVSADTLCHKLYSSFNEQGLDRNSAETVWTDSLKALRDAAGKMLCDRPNAYALSYADCIASLPTQSTQNVLYDADIPFLQMVLHGVTSYSMPANNQYADFRRSVLTALETGSSLQFVWIARNAEHLDGTQFDILFSAEYGDWIDDAAQAYEEIAPFMRAVSGRTISGHEILQDNVRRTTYDNGAAVTVNYNDYDVVVDGETIAAKGYKIAGA